MKIIFLDVDGVLNNLNTKERISGYIGIDDYFVEHLAQIVDETDAQIVLTSTWKSELIDCNHAKSAMGLYLLNKLTNQHLKIYDILPGYNFVRGKNIKEWLENHPVEQFIILDDEVFDFDKPWIHLMDHLIRTSHGKYDETCGLHMNLVLKSIERLKSVN